jgi:hypothetical protein
VHVFGANGASSKERRQIHDKYAHQYHNLMWLIKGTPFADRFATWA